MRYLKLFEDHNQFYQKLSIEEFREIYDKKPFIHFDTNSITNLQKLIKDNQIIDSEIKILIDRPGYSTVERLFDFTKYVICDDIITFVTFNTSTHGVDIHMMDDEWFFVSILKFSTIDSKSVQTFYLCDQWEGFVKLIKDKNIV